MNLQEVLAKAPRPITPEWIKANLTKEQAVELAKQVIPQQRAVGQERQLELYRPASERCAQIHGLRTKHVLAVGGNRSGKTETGIVDAVIRMTGIVPWSLEDTYPREKIACPMRVRLVCESLTNTWATVIRPKLQYDKWNGRGDPGGPFGHWGWIPRRFLRRGRWEDSWSEKERTLTLTCGCTLQIMSYDQEVQDFSGASVHLVLFDEAPPADIYRENLMRTVDTDGQLYFGFTPPDDPGKAMRGAWIYELFEKGLPGPSKDPGITSVNLFTEENRILDAKSIQEVTQGLTPTQRETRLRGAFMHLSGRIYPHYTDVDRWWCFRCNDVSLVQSGACVGCNDTNIVSFNHWVEPFDIAYHYPCIMLIDPHPRKPNMMLWVTIDPADDWWVIAELEVDGEPELVRDRIRDLEHRFSLNVVSRLIDPNMAESPAHSAGRRHITVRDEFDGVGLRCALADDNFSVGMKRVRDMFKPDERTKRPRIHVFNTCPRTNKQIKNYVWQEWAANSQTETRDPKPEPIAKEDDYPTMLRYLANAQPTYRTLRMGQQPLRATRRERTGAYA